MPDSTQITNSVKAARRQCFESEEHDEQEPDESWDHETARERRADPGEIDRRTGPLPDQGAADALVEGGDAVDLQDDPRQQEAERDRQPEQDRVAAEDGREEDPHRMARADRCGKSLGRAARSGLEQRRP